MLPENYTGYGKWAGETSASVPWLVFVIDGDIVDRADDGRGRWTGEPGGVAEFYNPIEGVPGIGRSPKDTRPTGPEPGYYRNSSNNCVYYLDDADGIQGFLFKGWHSCSVRRNNPNNVYLGVDPPDGTDRCPIDPLFTEPEATASEPTPTPEPPEAKPLMPDLTPSTAIVECTYDTLPLGACFQYVNGDPDTVYQKVHLSVGTGGMDDAQRKRAVLVSCKPGGRWPIGTVFPSTNTDTRRVVPVLSHLQVWR